MRFLSSFFLLIVLTVCFVSCNISKINLTQESVQNDIQFLDSVHIENIGVAGNSTLDILKRLNKDVLVKKPDLVILMVGTNDMLNSKKFVSYEDYRLNLNEIVKRVKANNSEVLLMSPPTVDSTYLYMRHNKSMFLDAPNKKLKKATSIIKEIVAENNALFVDVNSSFRNKGLPVHNQDDYIINEKNSNKKDGVHMKAKGYKYIAENIFSYLEEGNLLTKYANIICLGDSLTKGSGAKGAGTITGENYPSFLNIMINNHLSK